MNVKILLRTDIDSPSGYSAHARQLVQSLLLIEEVDLKIEPRKHDTATVPFGAAEQELYHRLTSKEWVRPDILIHFETPEFYEPLKDCFNIGFTMWETTNIPSTDMDGQPRMNWVHQMNQMDEIWTAATDAETAFGASGVKTPVRIFSGPIDTDLYKPDLPELAIRGLTVDSAGERIERKNRPFVIGFMGQWTKRKNIEDWLLWLMSQFKKGETIGLIKTYGSHMTGDQTQAVHQRIGLARQQIRGVQDGAGINLITNKLSDQDIARWFQTPDMYVSFSRGEGFALPVVQAMSSGCVVAHTAFGGPRDYIRHGENGYLLPCSLEPVTGMIYNPWYRADQWWARVDMGAATKIIVDAMKYREKDPVFWSTMQEDARETIIQKCSIQAIATQLAKRFAELYDAGLVQLTAAPE